MVFRESEVQNGLKTKINIWYIVADFLAFSVLQGLYQTSKQYTVIPYSRFSGATDRK